jgi:hypothetical protein
VEADRSAALPAVVISVEAARVLFPDGPAVGRHLRRGRSQYSVVGVVEDTALEGRGASVGFSVGMTPGPGNGAAPQVYEVMGREVHVPVTVVVRVRGSDPAMEQRLREVVRTLGPRAVVSRIRTGADVYWSHAVALRARQAQLLGLFGTLGLILALLGVFGVTAYAVARRTPEIGVRLALGASPGRVVRGVVRDSVMPAAIGVALGLGTTMILARIVPGFLYVEFLSGDIATRAVVAILLVTMTGLASWLPARRAGRVDPVCALRVG